MQGLKIEKLSAQDYGKCRSIWDMDAQPRMARLFYEEMLSGNREIFICISESQFIAEGSVVYEKDDPHYTIKGVRLYFSRLIVKEEYRNRGIGGAIIDYLVKYASDAGYREASIGVDADNTVAINLYMKKGFTIFLFKGRDESGEYIKLLKQF